MCYPGTGGSRGKGWQISTDGVPGQLGMLKRETLSRKTKSKQQEPQCFEGFVQCIELHLYYVFIFHV